MPATAFQLRMAKQSGEALIRRLGLTTLPIDPFDIAARHEIVIQPKPDAAEGVSGMLLRHGNNFGILYATSIPSEGFQRFSVAHELGHYFLEGHVDHVLQNGQLHVSQAGYTSSDPYEQEADQFAAGLLMPAHLFGRAMSRKEAMCLSGVEEISALCRTSLTATAIRCAELCNEALAVIVSTGQTVDYCLLSEKMKVLSAFDWVRKSTPLPEKTITARFNATPDKVERAERETAEIDIVDWLGGDRSMRCLEEVLGLGRYGKTLTILTFPRLDEEDRTDEDDDGVEDMVDHFSRRFRR